MSRYLLSRELPCSATAANPDRFKLACKYRLVVPEHFQQGPDSQGVPVVEEAFALVKELSQLEKSRNLLILEKNRESSLAYWDALRKHRLNLQQRRSSSSGAPEPLRATSLSTAMSVGALPEFMRDHVERSQIYMSPLASFPIDDDGGMALQKLSSSGMNLGKKNQALVKSGHSNSTGKGKNKRIGSTAGQVALHFVAYLAPASGNKVRGVQADGQTVIVLDDGTIEVADTFQDGVSTEGSSQSASPRSSSSDLKAYSNPGVGVAAAASSSLSSNELKRFAMVIPKVKCLPKSIAWVRTRRNVDGADQKDLRYLPYFSDEDGFWNDKRLETAVSEHFDQIIGEIEPEVNSESLETAILWLVEKHGGLPVPYQSMPHFNNSSRGDGMDNGDDDGDKDDDDDDNRYGDCNDRQGSPISLSSTIATDSDQFGSFEVSPSIVDVYTSLGITRERLTSTFTRINSARNIKKGELAIRHDQARIKRFGNIEFLALLDPLAGAALYSYESKCPTGLGLSNSVDFSRVVANYRDLFCRFCYIYDCSVHFIKQPQPKKKEPFLPFPSALDGGKADPVDEAIANVDLLLASRLARASKRARLDAVGASADEQTLHNLGGDAESSRAGKRANLAGSEEDDKIAAEVLAAQPEPSLIDFYRADAFGNIVYQSRGSSILVSSNGVSFPPGPVTHSPVAAAATNFSPAKDRSPENQPEILRSWNSAAAIQPKLYSSLLVPTATQYPIRLLDVEKATLRRLSRLYGGDLETITLMLGTRSISAVKSFMEEDGLIDSFCIPCDTSFTKICRKSAVNLDRKLRPHNKGNAKHYIACNHEGDCKESNCSCLQKKMFCEKYCACDFSCKHKFKGCKCGSGSCRTPVCPCFASSRECDPDLCGKCGAGMRDEFLAELTQGVAFAKAAAASGEENGADSGLKDKVSGCKNTVIRRGRCKRTRVGISTVHGWGLYLLENAKKDDLIIEYLGEVISQPEADRRGVIYDKQGLSYLFNINDDAVVDATRVGNNAKFINHDEADANLYPKIFFVDGDYRVGFFAKKNLSRGVELTFNYGYADDVAPDWAHKLGRWRENGTAERDGGSEEWSE